MGAGWIVAGKRMDATEPKLDLERGRNYGQLTFGGRGIQPLEDFDILQAVQLLSWTLNTYSVWGVGWGRRAKRDKHRKMEVTEETAEKPRDDPLQLKQEPHHPEF